MANKDTTNHATVYEIGYLLAPTIPEDELASVETSLLDHITDSGGDIVASQSPEMRELSYEIEVEEEGDKHQFARGQFGWVQFSLSGSDVDTAESAFVDSSEVIRHLLITVDPEAVGNKPDEAEADE